MTAAREPRDTATTTARQLLPALTGMVLSVLVLEVVARLWTGRPGSGVGVIPPTGNLESDLLFWLALAPLIATATWFQGPSIEKKAFGQALDRDQRIEVWQAVRRGEAPEDLELQQWVRPLATARWRRTFVLRCILAAIAAAALVLAARVPITGGDQIDNLYVGSVEVSELANDLIVASLTIAMVAAIFAAERRNVARMMRAVQSVSEWTEPPPLR